MFPDPPFLPGNSYRQKTRPGCCPEQELIAQRMLDDKSRPGGLLPREIPIFIGSLWAVLPGRTAFRGKPGEQCAVFESCNALACKVLRSNACCIPKSHVQNPAGGMSSPSIRNLLRYTSLVCSRASRIATTLALLTCLVCPLVETFDNWDHTIHPTSPLADICVGMNLA